MENLRPIGVFDSGVGGLTVVSRIQSILPHENIIYLGDTARVPYGTKSEETIKKFTLQSAAFFAEQGVKCIVLACNTASAAALADVRAAFPEIPVIGMIETGARFAVSHNYGSLALIGTSATVRSRAYSNEISRLNASISVSEIACPLFVPLVEDGILSGSVCTEVFQHYLGELRQSPPDALILGCTHYPLLKNALHAFLPSAKLIDSGEAAAMALAELFDEKNLRHSQEKSGFLHCFLTSPTDTFRSMAAECLTRDLDEISYIDLD